jgi:C4-dicarboxylate-specific signal transduction histidine kinase
MAQIAHGAELGPSEYRLLGDAARVVEVHSNPFEWDGEAANLAFVRDVTDRRRMQEELLRADRLAALGTMAAAVAHEINNPLTYVELSLQRLERELAGADDPRAQALLEHVRNALHGTARVGSIVRDLRTFTRADEEPPSAVDVVAAVERALRMVDHDLRHRARVVKRFPAEAPTVRGSASRLEQVLVNLLVNATHALRGDPSRDEITVEVRTDEGVTIAVRDARAAGPRRARAEEA